MKQYAIVAIGYNRPKSMQRLLDSLDRSIYGDDVVDLIISIDNSETNSVEKCANSFSWKYGEKKVVTYPERQGLRKHILHCGDFLQDYDAIAVFEDDVVVAPGFYSFMKAAVEKYANNDRVAGISLYNHLWNVHVNMPFEPAYTPYDTYFFQFAQSWGQVWMKKQWFAFKAWYEQNDEEFGNIDGIPRSVCGWPKSSWLKYHIRYCIETDKYFVYPYKALSTCFSDVGEHNRVRDTHLQVPMVIGNQIDYRFPNLGELDCAIYDAYFERKWSNKKICGINSDSICVDLYGYKEFHNSSRYLLSMKSLPYKRVAAYGLQYHPHEINVELATDGNDIILYDTSVSSELFTVSLSDVKEFRYRFKLYGKTKLLVKCIGEKVSTKIKNQK